MPNNRSSHLLQRPGSARRERVLVELVKKACETARGQLYIGESSAGFPALSRRLHWVFLVHSTA